MASSGDIASRLRQAPLITVQATLVRCVALQPLAGAGAPDYLLTSGRANRYNPAGIACVYFSADEPTARAEYGRRLGRSAFQPVGTYFARINLARVLDLTDAATRKALGFSGRDMSVAWQRAKQPTRGQLLGLAVSQQGDIAAIRFPSDAAAARGQAGVNFVVFRDCVRAPDSVEILGPTSKPLQKWP